MKAIHQHPLDATEMVRGRLLGAGEKLQKGDVYTDSTSRKWQPVPDPFIGSTVDEHGQGNLVRPEQ